MKKWISALVVGVAALTMANAVMAEDSIKEFTIVNTASKTGGFFLETNALYQDTMNDYKVEYINQGNACGSWATIEKLDKSKPVVYIWDATMEVAMRAQNTCPQKLVEREIIRSHYDSYFVCSVKPELTGDKLREPGASYRFGHVAPPRAYINSIEKGFNAEFKTNHKPILFTNGTGSAITAMTNGEIDYAFVESKYARKLMAAGTAHCEIRMDTHSEDKGVVALGSFNKNNKFLRLGYYGYWGVRNASDSQVAQIKALLKSKLDTPGTNSANLWIGSNMKFTWDNKLSVFSPEWEDAVSALSPN